ncbi:hypothetical protein GUITHDRAFT_99774 [Guillardia theta CCMP2712]|uniref:Uncharacterized protein n=1 Tax=Guillardia theta (strain CCMP2712) TaxID=905079 RepID=L1K143_GUITC|nr:hypothetical protein GUITHDRAFT_99774 [Guillardia theta CCMP2712]EKX54297.1 hypothetical protein GUITHDRAFT_99774 [Guillardia theta CCMP2712]|eukprot:XP_005841277.1 hypothetical protein GUITHDRAFT_99774 [Guillardia theta CCMP2712]
MQATTMGDLWLPALSTATWNSSPTQNKISDHRVDGLRHAHDLRFLWYLADHHGTSATLTAEWDGCAQKPVYGDPAFHRLPRARLFRQSRARMGLANMSMEPVSSTKFPWLLPKRLLTYLITFDLMAIA